MKLSDKVRKLESEVIALKMKLKDLVQKTETKRLKPESRRSKINLSKQTPLPSTGTGLGKLPARAGNVIFNDADAQNIPFGTQPNDATKGYNKHFHGRFCGGALDINTLEIVEYDLTGYNKDCQAYWKESPDIEEDENGEQKLSSIADNMVWDSENKVWRFLAVYAEDE